MRRYPAYKDSGVEWLGKVPKEWEVVPLKVRFSIVGGTTPKSDNPEYWDGDLYWITPADLSNLPDRFIRNTGRRISRLGLNSCGTTLVAAGAIALSTRAPIGSIAITTVEACTNQGCRLLAPADGVVSGFYYYVLLSAREHLNLLGRGSTFLELSGDQLGAFRVPLPPLSEQQAIAAFLDRETAKIDAMVEEQRRLIALLAEKRQAVISHAVTRGLNPDAPLKPSGIDWLGDIPEGWEVVPLKRLTPEITVGIVVEPSQYYVDEGIPALRSLNVRPGRIVAENLVFIGDAANELLSKSRLSAGDIVAVRTGQPGTSAVVPPDFHGANCIDLIIIRQSPLLDSEYLVWFLSSSAALRQFIAGSGGAIQQHFNVSAACLLSIVVPPLDEQRRVAAFLASETSKVDALTSTATTAITLLQERRAALISAAVTGKIDVRDLSPQSLSECLEPA